MLRICHISDTHGARIHTRITIPECDILIHSGDIGGRTDLVELETFLLWFSRQPAKYKIFVAGNHDICLDSKWVTNLLGQGRDSEAVFAEVANHRAIKLVNEYVKLYPGLIYLDDDSVEIEGLVIYGSPYSPSFHRRNWAFNADRGSEIRAIWKQIPKNTNILVTHGPPHGILDIIPENFKQTPDEDVHRGCEELLKVIETDLKNLKLHCFGHIHEGPTLIQSIDIEGRPIIFSNGAAVDNRYNLVYSQPPIIVI